MRYLILSVCIALSFSAFGQSFDNYEEVLSLGSKTESFKMVAIPGGQFDIGSPESESNRKVDEGPVHSVLIDSLWMGQFEMTWELFELYQNKDLDEKETDLTEAVQLKVDAISRPSPPFEDPSLGMGKGGFPVVNISPYAARQPFILEKTFLNWMITPFILTIAMVNMPRLGLKKPILGDSMTCMEMCLNGHWIYMKISFTQNLQTKKQITHGILLMYFIQGFTVEVLGMMILKTFEVLPE